MFHLVSKKIGHQKSKQHLFIRDQCCHLVVMAPQFDSLVKIVHSLLYHLWTTVELRAGLGDLWAVMIHMVRALSSQDFLAQDYLFKHIIATGFFCLNVLTPNNFRFIGSQIFHLLLFN